MSDLKFIMDTEDRDSGDDKYSGQPSLSGSVCSPNSSSTTKNKRSDDNSQPSNTGPSEHLTRRRGPLSRSSRSITTTPSIAATASVEKKTSSRSPLVERRSVDSAESMDTANYGNYGHTSSPSSMPPSGRSNVSSRPVSNATGEGNIPVKLTPITGRVSRAKKGVPVHVCEICKPAKTFTRAEHLRRHQLSHKPAAYQCHYLGCDKTFHRQDLLTRHTQRHEQDDRSGTDVTASTPRQPSHAPGEGHTPSMGFLQPPMLPGNKLSIASEIPTNSAYTGNTPSYLASPHSGSSTGQAPMSPSGHSTRSHSAGPSQEQNYTHVSQFGTHPSSMDGSLFHSTSYGQEFQPRRSSLFTYVGMEDLPNLTIPDSNIPGHLSLESNWPSSASDSPYSTPDRAVIRGFESPSADVADSMFYLHQYPSPQQAVYQPDFATPYSDDTGFYDIQPHPFPVRDPTPPTVTLSAQPTENLVTLVHSVPGPPAVLGRQKYSAALLGAYSGAAFLTALALSPAVLNAIPHYLDVYWKRFDTLFPLVHRQNLENAADDVLRCAMAAIGSQFLQGKEDRINGEILYGFASQEARRRPQWSTEVMQAILLCEFYGRFRGLRPVIRPSEPFQSLYSRVSNSSPPPFLSSHLVDSLTFSAFQDHLFSLVLSPSSKPWHLYSTSSSQVATPQTPNDHSTAGTSHRHWDEWIITESRRRLLAACFILDVHAAMYHEHSIMHNFLTPTPPIPLTKPSQYLWEAQNPEAWEALLASEPAQLNSVSLADEEITTGHIATAPPLDLALYLASETLRLPCRSSPSTLDVSAEIDLDATKRMCTLFHGSAVANTYLALHHTPLRDLLAVSGDSWLFSRKILDPEDFQKRKFTVRSWSNSAHAGAAFSFAAKALLIFLYTNDNTPNAQNWTEKNQHGREWNMSNISDYWALYVCTLICWALSYRTTRGAAVRGGNSSASSSSTSTHNANSASGEAERGAEGWLKMVANLSPEAVMQNVRGRREALGVIIMVRRRLEEETAGGKSKLLVDAVHVLKNLEENPNRGRF
ncbi:hypothetical protein HD806DRAFT_513428 [Xylariaceae sp. AK1471]|nr:hypothetical protein HD806DRAFT_513428 [Xylariaceae sp. AK1471]